jgi:CRISPR-associated protein Cst1
MVLKMKWIGDPYIDIGLAVIIAFCEKDDPDSLDESDLERVASWALENYPEPPLRNFLAIAHTFNSWFAQPALDRNPEKRAALGRRHLYAWREPETSGERCVFTGGPAAGVKLENKLPAGRAGRAQIPLVQSSTAINFFPNGSAGLPVSGDALLCLQLFPLGCAQVANKLLAVHASDPMITLRFVKHFLALNLENLEVARRAGKASLPPIGYSAGTVILDALMRITDGASRWSNFSITAYHLTNEHESPGVTIYHLPCEVLSFLKRANDYQATWSALVERAWASPSAQSGQGCLTRNALYEDLLRLPERAGQFVQMHFLRTPLQLAVERHRASDSTHEAFALISWDLTAIFLHDVMNMTKAMISNIQAIGEQIARYIEVFQDKTLLREIFTAERYEALRQALIKANLRAVVHLGKPLFTYDEFISTFGEGTDAQPVDWKLVRDLLAIRLIECIGPNSRERLVRLVSDLERGRNLHSQETVVASITGP